MHRPHRFTMLFTTVFAAVAALASSAQAAPSVRPLSIDELQAMEGKDRYVADRLIVKFRSDATEADKAQPQAH
jgi:hypothetical protein